MSRPWMPLYVADYLRDTRKLTAAEHGAYLLLIMEYWTAGSLPEDDRQLARIASMSATEWKRARPNIEGFFHSGWKHKRLDAELTKSAEISSKRAASAKQRYINSSTNAVQMETHTRASPQPQSQQQPSLRSGESAPAKRGTRLPAEWKPGDDDWIEANQRMGGNAGAQQELLKFHDYWKAQPGQRGVKLDWDATWRNWIRNAKGNANERSGSVRANTASGESRTASIVAGVAAATQRRFGGGGQGSVPGEAEPAREPDAELFRDG